MQNAGSFLQPLCRWMTATAMVLLFVIVTAPGPLGGRRNVMTAYAETPSVDSAVEESILMEAEAEETQVTKANIQTIQFQYTDPELLREGQLLAGDTLVKDVERQNQAREAQQEANEQAKEAARQIEEERTMGFSKRSISGGNGASASMQCSTQDYELLKRIVQAEAGGCDEKGRILVANVIMNRVKSEEFPDTITEVVYQKSQFSPVSDGRLNSCQVTQETVEAVDRALAGEDYSQGALYFMNRRRSGSRNVNWFDRNLTYLFQHESHEFFR